MEQTLAQQILSLMKFSTMDDQERQAWTNLVPLMTQEELERLHESLKREVGELTQLYMSTMEKKSA